MSRYVMPVSVSSVKKNGQYTFWLEIGQNALTLGESRWCSTYACGFSDSHILTLRRFAAPLTWNVTSSLNCTFSGKWLSELIKSCNSKLKSSRTCDPHPTIVVPFGCGMVSTPNAYAEPSTLLFSTLIAPLLKFPLISSDYAENWPETVQGYLQRLMGDHLISACTDTQFQWTVYTTHEWSCL